MTDRFSERRNPAGWCAGILPACALGVLCAFLTLASSGCSFLSSKPSRFYSLDRIPTQTPASRVAGLPIGIDVVLPPGVDRKEVVVRQADHRLEIRGREQWTATLQPLARVKDSISVLTGLTQHNAFALGDGGGDHARSAATWLTGCHPRKTDGADIKAGPSADQIAASVTGKFTRFASLVFGRNTASSKS